MAACGLEAEAGARDCDSVSSHRVRACPTARLPALRRADAPRPSAHTHQGAPSWSGNRAWQRQDAGEGLGLPPLRHPTPRTGAVAAPAPGASGTATPHHKRALPGLATSDAPFALRRTATSAPAPREDRPLSRSIEKTTYGRTLVSVSGRILVPDALPGVLVVPYE
jgi:hypothetical protein